MAKGFYISKALGILGIVLGVAAACTIIALSVVYAQEKNKNAELSAQVTTTLDPSKPTVTATPTTTLDQSKPWNRYRLPRSLVPDSYKVTLRPYLTPNQHGLYIFEGSSTVRFTCREPTNVIIIHSKKLNYTDIQGHRVALQALGGAKAPEIDRTELVEATEYLVVHLKGQLEAGVMYEMSSEFQGELADDLAGFYRSEYMDGNEKKVLATTQMQSADARKSFPCFDEPAMKARFNITLIHPHNLTALSNMLPTGPSTPLKEDPTWHVTEFHTTPVMSTYLLAYIVSEFTYVNMTETMSTNQNVLIRIWARPSATAAGHGQYALNVTGRILNFFAQHYNTPYPLDKSAQPTPRAEWWSLGHRLNPHRGLFPQSYLQTFSYKSTTYLDLWEHLQKAVSEQSAIKLPKDVKTIMDPWILQMGFPVITVDTKTGTISQKHFLLDPDSVVTRPSNFRSAGQPVAVPSPPLPSALPQRLVAGCCLAARGCSCWREEGQGSASSLLSYPTPALVSPPTAETMFKTTNEWVLLNVNVTGYYQVNYDTDNWNKIQAQLQRDLSVIPVLNRAQVIHDAFDLASARQVPVTLALGNTLFLINEKEYLPWQAAVSSLSYFKLMFEGSEVYGSMQKYLKKQVTPLFRHFENLTGNWTKRPEKLMDQYNEVNAISTACSSGVPECQTLASSLFSQWMADPSKNPIHPNLRSTIYCNAIAQGGEAEWDFAWDQFRNATLVNEADKLRAALACSKEVWILNRYLEYTLDPNLIRKQDATSTISSIAGNIIGKTLAWDFVQINWKKLFNDYGGGSFSFSNLIQAVTRRFSTEHELQQLEQFKKNNMDTGFGSATRALEQALEKTKANIKWVKENKEVVHKWFKDNSK
ncbi:PREDICTED: aminopeptidase N [Myotis brandtii]|nr:PREDICTED: aminopeptidase N [Myotis brandtii]